MAHLCTNQMAEMPRGLSSAARMLSARRNKIRNTPEKKNSIVKDQCCNQRKTAAVKGLWVDRVERVEFFSRVEHKEHKDFGEGDCKLGGNMV